MNARKLPSGRWQSKVYIGTVDGKKQFKTVTEDTRKECLLKAAQIQAEANRDIPHITVDQAVTQYIDAKRGVLSPSTIHGYLKKQKEYITTYEIGSCQLRKLTTQKVQAWVSLLSGEVSRKTIINVYSLFNSTVRMFSPETRFFVTYPQGKKYTGYVPSTEEVLKLLAYAKEHNDRIYRACLLSAFGTFRRGEIACLTADDIHDGAVHVSKDMVKGPDGKYVIKLPKTDQSVRTVPLPEWVLKEMPAEGPLVDYNPDEITKWFLSCLKESGLPKFRFHDLRKHAVSLMAISGVSMASIQKLGGWSNMRTPQEIYIKALGDAYAKETKQYLDRLEALKF